MQERDLAFPQQACQQSSEPVNPTTEATQRADGPNFFRDGEYVLFRRAESIDNHELSRSTLWLTLHTKVYSHRTAQTHDSVMHQFVESGQTGTMRMCIAFFTKDIFRVKFAANDEVLRSINDDPAFPPAEARMLVGQQQDVEVSFRQDKESLSLESPSVTICIRTNPFRLVAYRRGHNVPFWKQRLSDLFTSDVFPTSLVEHHGRQGTYEAFTLDPMECVYGLGERFDSVERRGRPVDFVNHDAIGTSNLRSYINVPFFWSTNGYGCFLNSAARTEWDVGMSDAGTIGFSTEEAFMDYFIIPGEKPADILRSYTTDLTGTSPVPPIWAFGLWLSRNSYQSWDVVDQIIQKANEHRIPFDTIHLDTAWFHEDWNPDLIFCKHRFPEPEKKMAALLEEGIHVSLWQYNFVPNRDDNVLSVEAREHGYVGMERLENGSAGKRLYEYPEGTTGWKTDDLVIDFSNPDAAEWYASKISKLISQGATAIKTDFGDCIPPAAHYKNFEGRRFQNLYSLVYNSVIRKAVAKVNPNTAQWARSGTAGSQRYPVHWGGDSQCSWAGLQGSLRATLSIGLSGFAFFSHDIGGFIGKPSPELYIRWAQLALLSSHARSHGAGDDNGREPWYFGEQAVEVFRKFVNLRYTLLPYIIAQAEKGAKRGLPLVRAMVLEYPDDPNTWRIETQYFLGEDLLVAPTLQPLEESSRHAVYLPAGTWYNFWTKKKLTSKGEWLFLKPTPLDTVSIWVRSGAKLPFAKERLRTFDKIGELDRVECYGIEDQTSSDNGKDHRCLYF